MSTKPLFPPFDPDRPRGTVIKTKSKYRTTIERATMQTSHPRHQKVRMQAHHLISEYGVSLTNLGDTLEDLGYDINELENLVYIPSTLQGACLLYVQPHRGDHDNEDADDIDSNREPNYHDLVRQLVEEAMPKLEKACAKTNANPKNEVQTAMNKISAKIAYLIQFMPRRARLTKLWANYGPDSHKGCGGVDNVSPVKGVKIYEKCPVKRNHTQRQGTYQRRENIRYVSLAPYNLTPGN